MRISGNPGKTLKLRSWLWVPIAFGAVVLLAFVLHWQRNFGDKLYFCNMEKVNGSGKYYRGSGAQFSGGATQSNDIAFSGKWSAKCDRDNVYGPGVDLKVNTGDEIEVNVWRHSSDGYGVLAFQGDWNFYTQASEPVRVQGDWELLKRTLIIPIGVRNRTLKIYPYRTADTGPVYFDDLSIRHRRAGSVQEEPGTYAGPRLHFRVEPKELDQLNKKRLEALAYGNLISGGADLVAARMETGTENLDVQLRLKGDLLDHLKGRKWSFRVLTASNQSWQGMSEFSVHNSLSRAHIDEWVFHQLLEQEDILTTRYDFAEVALNDETLGIYAWEEHFNDALLRHRGRKPGVILRINEDGHWLYASKGLKEEPPWYESAEYEAYERKAVLDDPDRRDQFIRGQNLLHGLLNGEIKPAEALDTMRMAKFLALVDLCFAYHSINYTNIRFFYDPHNGVLEPLGYDGYPDDGSKWFTAPTITGSNINERVDPRYTSTKGMGYFHYPLFNDPQFMRSYVYWLEQFTREEYIQDFLQRKLPEIESREAFIRREYADYSFRWPYFFRNAEEIRQVLHPMELISLKAYQQEFRTVALESFHRLPLEVIGFGNDELSYTLPKPKLLESFNNSLPVQRYLLELPANYKHVFVRTLGASEIRRAEVLDWPAPQGPDVAVRPRIEAVLALPWIREMSGGRLQVATGTHTLRSDLLIPTGYVLSAGPGTSIQLENGASIISYSPLYFEGSEEAPVRVVSPSGTGGGVMVLDASLPSRFRNVYFAGLNIRKGAARYSDACISFVNTELNMERCYFLDAKGNSSLGLWRSRYKLSDSYFRGAVVDGLQLGYSYGSLHNLKFEQVNGKAVEVLGGSTEAYQLQIDSSGVGLYAGQAAQVRGGTLAVRHANQGLVATDEAFVQFDQVVFEQLAMGLVAFSKHPELGGGRLLVKAGSFTQVGRQHLLETGASIQLEGKPLLVQ